MENNFFEALKTYLDNPENEQEIDDYISKRRGKDTMEELQLERIHTKYSDPIKFAEIVDKIITKYDSDKYRDFWYNKGIEPPEPLFTVLMQYAQKYGREPEEWEITTFNNPFTADMKVIHNYVINLVVGQGAFIEVIKLN